MNISEKVATAQELCLRSAWDDLLAFSQKWNIEKPSSAESFFYLGIAYQNHRLKKEAEEAFRTAITRNAEFAKPWNALGTLACENKNYLDGVFFHEKAARLEPENKVFWYNLGVAYGLAGFHDKAEVAAERAIGLGPPDCNELQNLIVAMVRQGKWDQARQAFDAFKIDYPSAAATLTIPPQIYQPIPPHIHPDVPREKTLAEVQGTSDRLTTGWKKAYLAGQDERDRQRNLPRKLEESSSKPLWKFVIVVTLCFLFCHFFVDPYTVIPSMFILTAGYGTVVVWSWIDASKPRQH